VISDARGDFLSLTVRDVSLHALLTELSSQAGFQFTELAPVERTVSVACHRAPLDQVLTQLLQDEALSFLFVYGGGGSTKLKHVIVLGAQPLAASGNGAPLPAEEPGPTIPEEAEAFNPDAPLEQLLEWTAHADPRIRTAALEALTLHPTDERARGALMGGMTDADPDIRSVVVGLLGPFVRQWPGAEDVAMVALGDAAPTVRRLALLALWEASSPRLTEALNLLLSDHDLEIRAHAQELMLHAIE
jgi:hypothetical protein